MSQSDNKLLAALPRREFQRIRPLLRTLDLPAEAALPHCGRTRVYFPGTGLCSVIKTAAGGRGIEVACIGNEGVVGTYAFRSDARVDDFVQVADGTVQYLPLVLFDREMARDGGLREIIDGFSQSFLQTMIQAVACTRLHSTEQRCCRWLLSAHDRLRRARFELKVRFLARAMGVKNSEIAAIVTSLEELGLVRHDGSSITILDRVGLRRRACRCYDTMKRGDTVERAAPEAGLAARPQEPAKVLPMRSGAARGCTLCGSTTRLPHRNGHECILALDEEIASLVQRTHTLRKYRAQLMASRAQLFRDILKRSNGSI